MYIGSYPTRLMALDREEYPGHVISYAARLFARALVRRIGPHGVNTGQLPVLLILWEQDGVTQAELATRLAVEQPTMAGTLKRLERDGLIKRTPDAADGRQARIQLTRRGRSLEDTLTAAARDTNAAALQGGSAADAAQLIRIIKRVIANLEQDE